MKTKILYLSSWIPSRIEPTNGNFVERHALCSSKYNKVEILHAIGDKEQKEKYIIETFAESNDKVKTSIVYYRKSRFSLLNMFRRFFAYLHGFPLVEKPNIVHANILYNNLFFALYLKFRYRIPFVITEHWTAYQKDASNRHSSLWRFVAKQIANQAEFILPVCSRLGQGLLEMGVTCKMKVIPNVVDTDLFSKQLAKPQDKQEKNQKPKRFLHVSSLTYMKNIPGILDVFLQLHELGYDYQLSLGGDGPTDWIKAFITENKLEHKIDVFGCLSHKEVAEKMQNADSFVLFSHYENQPCVLAEAFSSGLFVFASDVGGISEFFPENFGKIIPAGDNKELIKEVSLYLKGKLSPANYEKMHQYSVETFGRESIARQFQTIYKQIENN